MIILMPPDTKKCREAAKRRVKERIRAGAVGQSEYGKAYKRHYSGVLGEFVVCKAYGCAWLGEYFEGDDWDKRTLDTAIGEVRATFWPDFDGGMRLYPRDDRLKAPYVWVTLQGSAIVRAKIVGWSTHKFGCRDEWWHPDIGDDGAWIVPRQQLYSMDILPTIKSM